MAPPARPAPRSFTTLASAAITPNMLRVTLGGEGIATFPPLQRGAYVKLMLPPRAGSERPTVRTYTVRDQRADAIDVDFALHGSRGNAGPATEWASGAAPGDAMLVGGPGPAKPLPSGADWYLIAGDMTALPAISVNLEDLPRDAHGVALIEIQHEEDRQAIDAPPGVEIHWLVNPEPGTRPDLLAEGLRSAGWREGRVYGWAAAEFSAMRALRTYLREERKLGPADLYISSYWKAGATEEAHKVAKREDGEQAAGAA